jgi:allantoin racemase
VLILGSTTMHQSHAYLSARLPVPVINPGPLSYKIAESMLALGLAHSAVGYPRPMHPRLDMLQTMFSAAAQTPKGPA